MSRIISCKVIASKPTQIVPADSSQPTENSDCTLPLATRHRVRADLVNYRMQVSGPFTRRPSYRSARDVPFGLVVDFVA